MSATKGGWGICDLRGQISRSDLGSGALDLLKYVTVFDGSDLPQHTFVERRVGNASQVIASSTLNLRIPLIHSHWFRLAQKLEALAAAPQMTNLLYKLYKFCFDPPPCFIAKLPPELLSEIFILHCQSDLSNASVIASVCTRWCGIIIAESRLWTSRISVDVDDLGELCDAADIRSPSMLLSTALRRWEAFKLDFRLVVTDSMELGKHKLGGSLFSTLLQHRYRWRSVHLIVDPPAFVIIPYSFRNDFDSLESFSFEFPGSNEDPPRRHSDEYYLMDMLLSAIGHAPNLTSLSVAMYPQNHNYLFQPRNSPSNVFSRLTHFEAQQCAIPSFVAILRAARTSLVSCSITAFARMPYLPMEAFTLPNLEALTLPYPSRETLFYHQLLISFVVPQLKELTFCGRFGHIGLEMELIRTFILNLGCHIQKLQLALGASMTDLEFARSELVDMDIPLITLTDL
ncbi:hypothetical protein E1B28_002262 [Marasmius oreades]|uniref:F-box domain-containing protein n=1 Tax=Marasmius oreades TaxID=181124 RepID=A0A9P7UL45_9AGAR|nr:uncharacterized protein E1B28_002262 [Marasmius oreades]KAG7086298.1 hypothetical protein E1B28_002262 [Marasmius oreades]